jgi:hypothetical protein
MGALPSVDQISNYEFSEFIDGFLTVPIANGAFASSDTATGPDRANK